MPTAGSRLLEFAQESGQCHDEQRDFDLIRRQYGHVVDIITYDDLLDRLRLMRESLVADMKYAAKNPIGEF